MKIKIFWVIMVLFLLTCIFLGLNSAYKYKEYRARDEQALIKISSRLEVSKDWEIVRSEIYCKRMPLGISLEEIKQEIGNITPIAINKTNEIYEYYDLYFLDTDIKLDDMSLAFDEEYLLKEKLIFSGFGELMSVKCP